MNNLLSYYGLVDAKVIASEKDLPVDVVHLIRHARTFSVQILFGFSSVFAVNQTNEGIVSF